MIENYVHEQVVGGGIHSPKAEYSDTTLGSGCGAQLVEQLLPTPEVCGSNPVMGKIYIGYFLLSTVLKRRK